MELTEQVEKVQKSPLKDQNVVYGNVAQLSDNLPADLIERAAHDWMMIGCPFDGGTVVESYIAPSNFKLGEMKIKKGSWVIGVVLNTGV